MADAAFPLPDAELPLADLTLALLFTGFGTNVFRAAATLKAAIAIVGLLTSFAVNGLLLTFLDGVNLGIICLGLSVDRVGVLFCEFSPGFVDPAEDILCRRGAPPLTCGERGFIRNLIGRLGSEESLSLICSDSSWSNRFRPASMLARASRKFYSEK